MTMIFSLHDSIAPNTLLEPEITPERTSRPRYETPHLVREKITIPSTRELMARERLTDLLKRSAERFPATLICGRAGTGKTAVAALFAQSWNDASWYSVDSTDAEWVSFSTCFSACLGSGAEINRRASESAPDQAEIAASLIDMFMRRYAGPGEASLIVMDDIHHLYEMPWFDDFFNLLIYSLPTDIHLLMLCRSKPPAPLWRLRSKQMLNVIDEKVLAFDVDETKALYRSLGLTASTAREAHRSSYGRVSKLLELAGSPSPPSNR